MKKFNKYNTKKLESASDGEHSENRSTCRNVKEEQGQFTNFMTFMYAQLSVKKFAQHLTSCSNY